MRLVRSRHDTRSAILGYLWCSGGSFRPDLAESVVLTEASVSRIIAELKAEGVIQETRRAAPYRGGPSLFITLSNNIAVAALEISNDRLYSAVGTLAGDVLYSERYSLPDGLDGPAVDGIVARAIGELAAWARRRSVALEQIAISIPGYHPSRQDNPIIALDVTSLRDALTTELPGTPSRFENSIVARALAYRLQIGSGHLGGPYFFVFVGHGVGGAIVDEFAESGSVEPCEIGHIVLDVRGARCRCGHHGCLETYVSTVALANILAVEEADLLARGDRWSQEFRISSKARTEIRSALSRLGLAIGNALNLNRQRRVIVAGWPSVLPVEDRSIVRDTIGQTLLGGADDVELSFADSALGREPASGLALATFSFIQRSGERVGLQERTLSA